MKKTKVSLKKLFKNETLMNQALTHRSWVNEHKNARQSNERLEFLGDAILEYIVSKELFRLYPDQPEGYLTALRANIVNTESLAGISASLKLGEKLFLSKGEEEGGGRNNPSILADTFEAVIGALYIDGGLEKAEELIQTMLLKHIDKIVSKPLKDPKSLLQELVQAEGCMAPKYEVVHEEGPDHDKIFTIDVLVDGKKAGTGTGKNKSEAAQNAAKNALENYS